jgi:hypothetical protein
MLCHHSKEGIEGLASARRDNREKKKRERTGQSRLVDRRGRGLGFRLWKGGEYRRPRLGGREVLGISLVG